jgi:oligopeptide transport system ATP-binding protein
MVKSSASGEKILEVRDLRTRFYTEEGEVKAVERLSLHVNKGESIGLVGESGCGKSVTALSIMRLVPYPPGIIVGGEIQFGGIDLLQASEKEMQHIRGNRISMVFQEPTTSLNPVLPIGKQIAETLELHQNFDKTSAMNASVDLLRKVGIPDTEKRVEDFPHQFSGGMQQRIMIAMAISCTPELLIADEPTTSVDATVQAQLLALISRLRTQFNTSVIFITHNLGLVARHVDRVYVMYAGRIVESASTEELFDKPSHPYTRGLLASVPRLDRPRRSELNPIAGLPPNLAHLPKGCSFHPRCEYIAGKCQHYDPELYQLTQTHWVACHRRGVL